MKNAIKRIKGIFIALMYVALYYTVAIVVQNVYALWLFYANGLSSADVEKSVIYNTYILTAVTWTICFLMYMFIGKIRKYPLKNAIKIKKQPPIVYGMAIVLAIGCRFLVNVYFILAKRIDVIERSIENSAERLPEVITTNYILMMIVASVMLAPIVEELLFRALVMGELNRIMRPWAAIVMQAVVFGVVHGVLFQSIFAFIIGIVLGVIYYKTQNIKVSVLCHMIFNFTSVLTYENLTTGGIITFAVAGTMLSVLSLLYIIAYAKRKED